MLAIVAATLDSSVALTNSANITESFAQYLSTASGNVNAMESITYASFDTL